MWLYSYLLPKHTNLTKPFQAVTGSLIENGITNKLLRQGSKQRNAYTVNSYITEYLQFIEKLHDNLSVSITELKYVLYFCTGAYIFALVILVTELLC